MKKLIPSLSLMALLCGSAAFAQSTATTTPVGFISETVGGGTISQPQFTLLSPTLTQPIAFQGTISSISGTTIAVSGANWTTDQFDGANGAYYVEVFSATKPGALSDIIATGTTSVTTADDLTAFSTAGDSIAIRKHVAIADFLGANNTWGLHGGTSITNADEVAIYSGSASTSYWYYDGSLGGSAGWYDINFNPSSAVTIAPHEAVVIKRKYAGNVAVVSTGTVKTGNTLLPIYAGLNVLGTLSAAGLTLDSSGLHNGTSALTASTSISTADEVLIYGGSTSTSYWYYDGSLGGSAGWYDVNFNPSGSVAIAPGTAFVVKRKVGAAFNWTLPSPTNF